MGKKRVAVLGEENQKKEKEIKKAPKSGKEHGKIADVASEALAEASVIEEKTKEIEKEVLAEAKKEAKKETKKKRKRGKKYQEAKKKVDSNKFYPLSEAIKILKNTSISKFKGNLDIHLNVKDVGLKGEIQFPHSTGKKQNIRIADETLIAELEKGKIDFTQLVASAKMMPKLVKYARLLGPKGLMPSPKNGTITEDPETFIKNASGKEQFKTEPKFPLIHLSLGKIEAPEEELKDNFKALIKVIGRKNIEKATLSPTMGPGVKIDLNSIND